MNRDEFFDKLFKYYNVSISDTNKERYATMSDLTKETDYEYHELYKQIIKRKYFGGQNAFPAMGDLNDLLNAYKVKKVEVPEQGLGKDWEYRCKACNGKGGRLVPEMRQGIEYDFFYPCQDCHGDGKCSDNRFNKRVEFNTMTTFSKNIKNKFEVKA